MGKQISNLCSQLQPQKKYVLVVGDKSCGKTTFVYGSRLKPGWEQSVFEPTVGYNYEEIRYTSGVLAIFDTPGNEALFPIVKNLYKNLNISAIVFVFRLSNAASDFIKAKRRIKFLANEPELKGCALAIVGNIFSDIDNQFKNVEYLKNALGLNEIRHIHDDKKNIAVFDAKYNPGESEIVWKWLNEKIETDE